jgi:hypothetical protein
MIRKMAFCTNSKKRNTSNNTQYRHSIVKEKGSGTIEKGGERIQDIMQCLVPNLNKRNYKPWAVLRIPRIEGLTIHLSPKSSGEWHHEQLVTAARDAILRLATSLIDI